MFAIHTARCPVRIYKTGSGGRRKVPWDVRRGLRSDGAGPVSSPNFTKRAAAKRSRLTSAKP